MMPMRALTNSNLAIILACAGMATAAHAGDNSPTSPVKWKKIQLTPEFWAEGACEGDMNRDGHVDVLSGPFWYEGPAFKKRYEIYPAAAEFRLTPPGGEERVIRGFRGFISGENAYAEIFLSFASDLNKDGWIDYIVVGFPGKETYWYENPKDHDGKHGGWRKHLAFALTDNESPSFVDLTGDGRPELLCMHDGAVGYAEPDPDQPGEPWKWHETARNDAWQWNTHGLGYGDVNGDGTFDLLTAHNWWESAPEPGKESSWKRHDVIFNNGGSQMFAYDVNGDGLNDVVTAHEGHGYGLLWHEQEGKEGDHSWIKHVIAGAPGESSETGVVFSQIHAIDVADINGDGLKDIVAGKRFWAHGPDGDVEPNAPAVLYWFELKREGTSVSHEALIDDDSGVGTQVKIADLNNDGKPDVVAANKKGLFVHLQQ